MAEPPVSNTRLYLGNLPRNATKADVENHFNTHGTGEIAEIKLMNGFGFIEYKDSLDARDVVPAFHGTELMGERIIVQFARGGNRPRDDAGYAAPRVAPRPRRTLHRMTVMGLPLDTSWQDLKDFARQSGLDVVYSEITRDRDANGNGKGFVEYETAQDLASAVEKLDNSAFKDAAVRCISDPQTELPRTRDPRDMPPRYRSRSPGYRRGPPMDDRDYYDRRGPPRGYSPRRDDYRRRSPPPGAYYDERDDPYRAPPPRRRGPPMDDYPPRGGRYADDRYGPPPGASRGYADADPYPNGRDPYARPPLSPRREGRGYDRGGYDQRPY